MFHWLIITQLKKEANKKFKLESKKLLKPNHLLQSQQSKHSKKELETRINLSYTDKRRHIHEDNRFQALFLLSSSMLI